MEEKLICITTVKSRIEAEQMLSFLKENGIYAAIQGGVQELYTGAVSYTHLTLPTN